MFAKIAAAAGIAAVSAQVTPNKPTFPNEWTATVSRTDDRNRTFTADVSFSVTNNAIIDVYTQGTETFTALSDYNLHTQFIVDSTGKCLSQPERGNINDRIPDLRRVTFMQNTTFNGINVYEWQDHATAPPNRYFVTMDANEYPVALENHQTGAMEVWSNFKVVTNWPAGTFTPAKSCNATA